MNEYSHQVSGFFANREEAQSVFTTLIERGVPREWLLGWGASIGGLLGATVGATKNADDSIETGANKKEGWLSDLVRDAIASEQTVLVVRAQTEQVAASGTDSEPFRPLAPVSIALVASVFIVKVEKNGGSAM